MAIRSGARRSARKERVLVQARAVFLYRAQTFGKFCSVAAPSTSAPRKGAFTPLRGDESAEHFDSGCCRRYI